MSLNFIRAAARGAAITGAMAAILAIVAIGPAAAARPAPAPVQDAAVGPVRLEAPLDANAEAVILAKAGAVKDALDFPPGKGVKARHVKDGFTRAEYDEVTDSDAAGEVLSITQFDARGLRLALRVDSPGRSPLRVPQSRALQEAQRAVGRLGFTAGSVATVDADSVGGGWLVRWARTSQGVRVRGDEVLVGVRADGKIGSLSRVEHDLAAAPSARMASSRALDIATGTLDGWFSKSGSGYEVQGVELQWVEPNGIFDPDAAPSDGSAYRQAWVVTVKPSGVAADHVRLMALYVDAADGRLIGGDTVE
jgi:hypothetical protein